MFLKTYKVHLLVNKTPWWFCPQFTFMCSIWFSQHKGTDFLNIISRLILVIEERLYCTVGAGSLYSIWISRFKWCLKSTKSSFFEVVKYLTAIIFTCVSVAGIISTKQLEDLTNRKKTYEFVIRDMIYRCRIEIKFQHKEPS
jgi:hypothetical protein